MRKRDQQRHRNLHAHRLSTGDDELRLPARKVRQADVMNLAGLHGFIAKRQSFLYRRVLVRGVKLISSGLRKSDPSFRLAADPLPRTNGRFNP